MSNTTEVTEIHNSLFKEKIQRIVLIRKKLDHVIQNIKNQLIENERTYYFITYLKDHYMKQKDKLDQFNGEKTQLESEYLRLSEEINLLQSDLEGEDNECEKIPGINFPDLDLLLSTASLSVDIETNIRKRKLSENENNLQSKNARNDDSVVEIIPPETTTTSNEPVSVIIPPETTTTSNEPVSVIIPPETTTTSNEPVSVITTSISNSICEDTLLTQPGLSKSSISSCTITTPTVSTCVSNTLNSEMDTNIQNILERPSDTINISCDSSNILEIQPNKENSSNNSIISPTGKIRKLKRFTASTTTSTGTTSSNITTNSSKVMSSAVNTAFTNIKLPAVGKPIIAASKAPPPVTTSKVIPGSTSNVMTGSTSNVMPKFTCKFMYESASKVIPGSASKVIPESNSKVIPESTSKVKPRSTSKVISESTSNVLTASTSNVLTTSIPSTSFNLSNYKTQVLSDQSKSSLKKNGQSLVQIRCHASPSEKVLEISDKYSISQIISNKFGLSVCGTKGLLMNLEHKKLSYFQGHLKKDINAIYQINDSIVSVSSLYVLIHKIRNPGIMKQLAHFSCTVACSSIYKSMLYVALTNRDLYIVDLSKAQITPRAHFFKVAITAMNVVKCCNKTFMVIAQVNGEVNCLNIDSDPIKIKTLGHILSNAKGITSDSGSVICYTENTLYFIDKNNWSMRELRQLTHEIVCLALDVNNVVLADSHKNLHRYIIKNGSISCGSTIESLASICEQEISAIVIRHPDKIMLAADNKVMAVKL